MLGMKGRPRILAWAATLVGLHLHPVERLSVVVGCCNAECDGLHGHRQGIYRCRHRHRHAVFGAADALCGWGEMVGAGGWAHQVTDRPLGRYTPTFSPAPQVLRLRISLASLHRHNRWLPVPAEGFWLACGSLFALGWLEDQQSAVSDMLIEWYRFADMMVGMQVKS